MYIPTDQSGLPYPHRLVLSFVSQITYTADTNVIYSELLLFEILII